MGAAAAAATALALAATSQLASRVMTYMLLVGRGARGAQTEAVGAMVPYISEAPVRARQAGREE